MRIVTLPERNTRVALLDMPGADPDAMVRVFLHGLGSSSIATFPAIAAHPALRQSRSILIDLPGFGYSSAPSSAPGSTTSPASQSTSFDIETQAEVVARVLGHLGLSQVHLVGHSMGGSIAIALAHRRPDLVAQLTVAEPNLDPGHGTLSNHIARRSEEEFVRRGYAMLVRGMQQQANRGESNAAIFLGTVLQASPVALHQAATSLLADRTPTFRDQFLRAPMPRTFIAGGRSNDVSPSDLSPHGIIFVEIPNAGHVMMDDAPNAFAQAVGISPA